MIVKNDKDGAHFFIQGQRVAFIPNKLCAFTVFEECAETLDINTYKKFIEQLTQISLTPINKRNFEEVEK